MFEVRNSILSKQVPNEVLLVASTWKVQKLSTRVPFQPGKCPLWLTVSSDQFTDFLQVGIKSIGY